MKKIISFIQLLMQPKRLNALLSYNSKGYLANIGWLNAFDKQQAIDVNGEPIPWVTYSFIDFIKSRLNKNLNIFEYGSGSSTLFYAKNAKQVVSVEHDKNWYEKMLQEKPSNTEIIFCELETNGEYAQKAKNLNQKFDLIIVDGRDRVNCCLQCLEGLTDNGVVILDDSEREFYADARAFLITNSFKELAFSGISPGLFYYKTTSVFYRSNNCLNI